MPDCVGLPGQAGPPGPQEVPGSGAPPPAAPPAPAGVGRVLRKLISPQVNFVGISALIALVAVVATGYYQYINFRTTRVSNSARMVMDLSSRYNSDQMRIFRSRFAQKLLDLRKQSDDSVRKQINEWGEELPVLNFFEEVGYLTRIGALDDEMVWNSFVWKVEFYYHAVTKCSAGPNHVNLLEEIRKPKYEPRYRELEWLHNRLVKIDRKERRIEMHEGGPTAEAVSRFLESETALCPEK